MSVGRICAREVDLAEAQEPMQVAAERMHARNVGTLVVLNAAKEPVGILTDRDLAIKGTARGLDPYKGVVADVMTPCPICVHEEAPIEEALRIMRSRTFRRLPVVNVQGKLVGLLSLDDILLLLAEEFQEIDRLLAKEGPRVLATP
jgi:CBS domain-containing protein